jgi:predicted SprT family Zn-dependent metalloprotease
MRDLSALFERINREHFDGFLDEPGLRFNSRLRTSAGRFLPGSRRWWIDQPPIIEVASYLLTETDGERHVADTMAHEMIHYWLWVRRRPYGHTEEFLAKMRLMGASRYNEVPRRRPHRYLYGCPGCRAEFRARKLLGKLACKECCRTQAGGKYDSRFRLELLRKL